MKAEEMWRASKLEGTYAAWAFCGGGRMGDELAELTLQGIKTGTASPYLAFELEKAELPKVGDNNIVLFDNGEAACIIRFTKISLVPFDEVSAEHAFKEGEGDRSLEYWKKVHREAFTPCYQAAGRDFDEKGLCVLYEFEMLYKED